MNFSYFSRVATLMTVGVCAALSAAQAAPDAHDFGIEIEKPPATKPKTDKPTATAPKVTTPTATAPKPALVPQSVEAVNVEAARVPLLLGQMEAGQLTPEAAWKSGALTREGLLFLFERHLDVWKMVETEKHRGLYLKLVGLLSQHTAQTPEEAKLSRKVRLWLGEFYRVKKDERAAGLLESVLDEFRAPVKSKDPVLFLATERLAWFYSGAAQHEKAAQTWLRLEELSSDAHWKADGVVEAAREYTGAGNSQKAAELYGRVAAYGDGWLSGTALWEQATSLLDKGRTQEAREVLMRPVTGRGTAQIQVLLFPLVGQTFYREGDFDQARQWSEKTRALYPKAQRRDVDLSGGDEMAQQTLRWIEVWQKQPLVAEIPQFSLQVEPRERISRRIGIRSWRALPLVATCDKAEVQVSIGQDTTERPYYIEQSLYFEIEPEAVEHDFEATLEVSSPNFPQFKLRVPLHIKVQAADALPK